MCASDVNRAIGVSPSAFEADLLALAPTLPPRRLRRDGRGFISGQLAIQQPLADDR